MSFLEAVGLFFVHWLGLVTNISETSVDISWYQSGVLDDELSFEDTADVKISCGDCEIAKMSARSIIIELY